MKKNRKMVKKKHSSSPETRKSSFSPQGKRTIGYSLAGLAIGISSYLFLQAGTPQLSEARAELIEFDVDDNFAEFQEKDFISLSKSPFLEYGGYYDTSSDLEDFERMGVVKYGKSNPTFYYKKEVKPPQEKKKESDSQRFSGEIEASSSEPTVGSSQSEQNIGGANEPRISSDEVDLVKTAEGFNVTNYESSEEDVAFISKAFYTNGKLPVDSKYYSKSSGYGVRIDPFEETKAYHAGLDLSAVGISGKEIYAVLDGVVKYTSSPYGSLGNTIMLEHNGFQTSYSHMILPSFLKEGDVVRAGDIIGYVGSTGRSTGPHLHFEVGIDNLRFDPEIFTQYIKGAN